MHPYACCILFHSSLLLRYSALILLKKKMLRHILCKAYFPPMLARGATQLASTSRRSRTEMSGRRRAVVLPLRRKIEPASAVDLSVGEDVVLDLNGPADGEYRPEPWKEEPKPIIWTEKTRALYNKSFNEGTGGKVHITAVNSSTGRRAIMKLELPDKRARYKIVTLSRLPEEAKEGLKASLQQINKHPKQMQHDADVLSNKLIQRRFPAPPGEIREARKKVFEEIMEKDEHVASMYRANALTPFYKRMIYEKAQRLLKKERYNWLPLSFKKQEDAAVFALSRLAPYYAEIQRVFNEFDRNGFVPETVLDYGSGIGSAFWVSHYKWGEKIKEYTLVEPQWPMRNFSMDIMRGSNFSTSGELINKNVYFRRNLSISPTNTYDLVIVHRTLIEMPSREERKELIRKLWKHTNRYLVIIESPLSESFKAVQEARELILKEGFELDFGVVMSALDERNLLDRELTEKLSSKRISPYEKFRLVQNILPDNFTVPTKMHPGYVYAPCPHDKICPKILYHKGLTPCKFTVRWMEVRSDHKTRSKNRDGTETGNFTYVIMEKGQRPKGRHPARILEKTDSHKCVTCKICTQNDEIQLIKVSARSKPIYKRVKWAKPSMLFPVEAEIVKTDVELLPYAGSAKEEEVSEAEESIPAERQKKIGSSLPESSMVVLIND